MIAKIYCIECNITGEKYIGSTIRKLCQRIACHKTYNSCVSRHIIDRGNWKYYLLEEVDESQRLIREQYYMDITDKCINYQRAIGYTNKEYCELNKDKKKEYDKQHYQLNKDKLKLYQANMRKYKNSWGGDPRASNNLLLIDPSLLCG